MKKLFILLFIILIFSCSTVAPVNSGYTEMGVIQKEKIEAVNESVKKIEEVNTEIHEVHKEIEESINKNLTNENIKKIKEKLQKEKYLIKKQQEHIISLKQKGVELKKYNDELLKNAKELDKFLLLYEKQKETLKKQRRKIFILYGLILSIVAIIIFRRFLWSKFHNFLALLK